jgi:hypothetical protein
MSAQSSKLEKNKLLEHEARCASAEQSACAVYRVGVHAALDSAAASFSITREQACVVSSTGRATKLILPKFPLPFSREPAAYAMDYQNPQQSQLALAQQAHQPSLPPGDPWSGGQAPQFGQARMDDRSSFNKTASNVNKTVGKVTDRTKVIYVKATGDGVQKVRCSSSACFCSRARAWRVPRRLSARVPVDATLGWHASRVCERQARLRQRPQSGAGPKRSKHSIYS